MELCDATIEQEGIVTGVHDLVDVDGVLTTSGARVTRSVSKPTIPSAATCLARCKVLFRYKQSRKRVVDDSDEEEAPLPIATIDDEDEDDDEEEEDEEEDEGDDGVEDNAEEDDDD